VSILSDFTGVSDSSAYSRCSGAMSALVVQALEWGEERAAPTLPTRNP
jgi:hypothetical protein